MSVGANSKRVDILTKNLWKTIHHNFHFPFQKISTLFPTRKNNSRNVRKLENAYSTLLRRSKILSRIKNTTVKVSAPSSTLSISVVDEYSFENQSIYGNENKYVGGAFRSYASLSSAGHADCQR